MERRYVDERVETDDDRRVDLTSDDGLRDGREAVREPAVDGRVRRTEVSREHVVRNSPAVGTSIGRMVLTLAGAAAMVVSAFLVWTGTTRASALAVRTLYGATTARSGSLVASVGAVMIVLAIAAVVGLAWESGWLTRVAGALGVVAFILFVITLSRLNSGLPGAIGIGAWVALAGSVVALMAGFLSPPRRSTVVVEDAR
jgi:hypothetical protein